MNAGRVVDPTLIAAPSSIKNKEHKRDLQMHSSKKGQQMFFGMKVHIGADAESGLVQTVCRTSGNVNDVTEGNSFCTDKRQMHSAMRDIRALKSGQMPMPIWTGTLQ